MAAALEFWRTIDHENNGAIFPISNMIPSSEHEPLMQEEPPASFSLDGSSDYPSRHGNKKSISRDVHTFFQQAKQRSVASADPAFLDRDPEGQSLPAHIDPNLDRRKRRRVTPANNVPSEIDADEKPDAQFHQELLSVSQTGETTDNIRICTPDGGDTVVANNSNVASGERKSDHDHQNEQQSTQPLTPRKRTPRKNVLSLHKDGTLVAPPPTSPSLKSADVVAAYRPVSSARRLPRKNMKMKNGKFVQSFELVLKYGHDQVSRTLFGKQIDDVLRTHPQSVPSDVTKTHPFFLGKARQATNNKTSDASSEGLPHDDTDQEKDRPSTIKAPVAWNDIKFSSTRNGMFKSSNAVCAIWPSKHLQHVGRVSHNQQLLQESNKLPMEKAKRKTLVVRMDSLVDILRYIVRDLADIPTHSGIHVPQRRLLSGRDLTHVIRGGSSASSSEALSRLFSDIESGASAFDKGETSGYQNWTTKYAPTEFQHVLQPACHILRDWLKSLAVHNVQSGIVSKEKKENDRPPRKKRRQKKSSDNLDDFIVDDDDDDMSIGKPIKNAVLITGPHGCGKTASIFAVAKEMGFEVFEIHPGMRRSAKDIFDKVGDMTQNHLVQQKDEASRSSSVAPQDPATMIPSVADKSQSSLSGFLGTRKAEKVVKAKETDVSSMKKEQKQSLILFEEVDILFESDKSFWTGVQNLIQQSKRPVVMTCNDLRQVPLSELELFTVLEYQAPDPAAVAEYLVALCACEGHIIEREAIVHLYTSKGYDLRATINELSFWCQMTVGSDLGGLDWMLSSKKHEARRNSQGELIRICSKGTFHLGLDLLPESGLNAEQMMRYCQQSLDLPVTDWVETLPIDADSQSDTLVTNLQKLDKLVTNSDVRSVLDVIDEEAGSMVALAITSLNPEERNTDVRKQVTLKYNDRRQHREELLPVDITDALDPISVEKPTFPPSHGRLAPSIEICSTAVLVDIAPYVRSIVSFDKQLELQREELFGSQGKKPRNTRAARAAAEGGDKAHTRAERWFPKHLDFDRVLATGNDWPQWSSSDEMEI